MPWRATGVAVATLSSGSLREVSLNGQSILLAKVGENLYAIEGICTHQGGILGDGILDNDRLVCPEHGANFDLSTGKVLVDPFGIEPPQGAVEPLRPYPTRIIEGMIEVELN